MLLFGAEALIIFSQTSRTLGLDDLKLKKLAFRTPSKSLKHIWPIPGCSTLLNMETAKVCIPLYLFFQDELGHYDKHSVFERPRIEFSFADERYFQVTLRPNSEFFSWFQYFIDIRDELSGTLLYLNLTTSGFNMTLSRFLWLIEEVNEKFLNTSCWGHHVTPTTSRIFVDTLQDNSVRLTDTLLVFYSMWVISDDELKSADFISSDGQSLSKNRKV